MPPSRETMPSGIPPAWSVCSGRFKSFRCRDLADVQRIVRSAARSLTGCDGATFVLNDRGFCYYADEDAIAPL